MTPHNQWNPQWANEEMGISGLKFGKWGCLATCVVGVLENTQVKISPKEFNRVMSRENGYMGSGDLNWQALGRIYPQVYFRDRSYIIHGNRSFAYMFTKEEGVSRIRTLIRMGLPVPVLIDAWGNDGVPDHWVLATAALDDGSFKVMNPDGGKFEYYAPGEMQHKAYGWATLIVTPTLASGDCKVRLPVAIKKIKDGLYNEAIDTLLGGT